MDNFRFYQECKVTCWERDYFTVEAENYEEAVSYTHLDVYKRQGFSLLLGGPRRELS